MDSSLLNNLVFRIIVLDSFILREVKKVELLLNNRMREAVIYPGEDGYWVAECPSLPGCVSQGTSREDAIVNIREAIHAYVLALEEDGLPVPFLVKNIFLGKISLHHYDL